MKVHRLEAKTPHIWHKKNSYCQTKVLGKVACIVTSKILGIGSAERAWGDVKHLKTNKRAHLGAETIKMQSTLFGAHCSEKANFRKMAKAAPGSDPIQAWNEEDLECLGLDKFGVDLSAAIVPLASNGQRIFRAWIEHWEINCIKKRGPLTEARLLAKYKNLMLIDIDSVDDGEHIWKINPRDMGWPKGKRENGWCAMAIKESFDIRVSKEEQDDSLWDFWNINTDLIECIAAYYKKYPDDTIRIVTEEEEEADAVDLGNNDGSDGEGGNV